MCEDSIHPYDILVKTEKSQNGSVVFVDLSRLGDVSGRDIFVIRDSTILPLQNTTIDRVDYLP